MRCGRGSLWGGPSVSDQQICWLLVSFPFAFSSVALVAAGRLALSPVRRRCFEVDSYFRTQGAPRTPWVGILRVSRLSHASVDISVALPLRLRSSLFLVLRDRLSLAAWAWAGSGLSISRTVGATGNVATSTHVPSVSCQLATLPSLHAASVWA